MPEEIFFEPLSNVDISRSEKMLILSDINLGVKKESQGYVCLQDWVQQVLVRFKVKAQMKCFLLLLNLKEQQKSRRLLFTVS